MRDIDEVAKIIERRMLREAELEGGPGSGPQPGGGGKGPMQGVSQKIHKELTDKGFTVSGKTDWETRYKNKDKSEMITINKNGDATHWKRTTVKGQYANMGPFKMSESRSHAGVLHQ